MRAATLDASATVLASTPLRPYIHQNNAVYGVMLPQPRLRFLLADEPGTGKTIMAGLYLREMQRLGIIRRTLIVAPAHLVPKWQADFERFFGGGLRRVTAATAHEGPLRPDYDLWIVSLDLAAVNPSVQEVIGPRSAGWDLVIFDEAHRLTLTAQAYYRVGRAMCHGSPRVLLMTATPHRGKEWLFRSLMHLVDPEVFPEVTDLSSEPSGQLRPGPLHFLRRMKEDLVDYDGITPLFHGRRAKNMPIALNATERGFYNQALDMVATYFPRPAVPLASMVYGKRAASSLYSLACTLRRRREGMGTDIPTFAAANEDPDFEDTAARDEARVIVEQSRSAAEERKAITSLLNELEPLLTRPELPGSKWPRMVDECLTANGIHPGGHEQAVVFTEYADTADWLVERFRQAGFSAERYSGKDPAAIRDAIRARFEQGEFQIIVSTDAGNEGIDLQTAHVLINWDIPWSLIRLEQRMGRIHRIGQSQDVELYNLVATDTREGEVLTVLLDNFVAAANALQGKLFDSLSLVAETLGVDPDRLLSETYQADPNRTANALAAARAMTAARVQTAAQQVAVQENALKTQIDVAAAVAALQRETLERINPRIVEAFLRRLDATGRFRTTPHAAGEGLFVLSTTDRRPLPKELGGHSRAVVASSGAAIANGSAAGADVSGVQSLGPSEPAFRSLVEMMMEDAGPALFQGGVLTDPTSVTDYDLLVYEANVTEAGGRRKSVWSCLMRVDATGARPIRWEILANLQPERTPRGVLHPARAADADERAAQFLAEKRAAHQTALAGWLKTAERELQRLPSALTSGVMDAAERRAIRARVEQAVADRRRDLEQLGQVDVGPPRRLGWAHVIAAGTPPSPTDKDSEAIAMARVTALLRSDGWAVADVHTEGRGYDLHAVQGPAQRCVEVKGVWQNASSQGIQMTGNEVLVGRQLGTDYWLYVVDQCSTGGRLFGMYPDPVALFGDAMKDVSVVTVPGSALLAARDARETA
jgi:superfamily II DNA or RNA helicase